MPKVVPSQVVALIDQAFPTAKDDPKFNVYKGNAATLLAIIRLCRDLSSELLTISGEAYADYVHALAALEHSVTSWNIRGGDQSPNYIRDKSPVAIIREVLTTCPDENPSPATAELTFITDKDLRDSVRLDLSTATSAFHNGEWKASTVLAGAAVEALLLWKIQDQPSHLGGVANKPQGVPKGWSLAQLINVADQLKLIKSNTADQARLAKNFRNLIHPGRAQRTREDCDRATALTALAAAEHVVRDLS